MKVLVDMNLSPLWVSFLIERGFDAFTGRSLGRLTHRTRKSWSSPKPATSLYLPTTWISEGFSRCTIEVGPVQIRTQDVLPSTIGQLVIDALNAARTHLEVGALVTVDPVNHRIRLLPL